MKVSFASKKKSYILQKKSKEIKTKQNKKEMLM